MDAYVDESGDEGTRGQGTRWLIFGCAVIQSQHIEQVDLIVDFAFNARRQNKGKCIHFTNLDHAAKKGILTILQIGEWHGIVVASDTAKALNASWLHKPKYQYNYALRYVMERISRYAKSINEKVDKIVIEKRRNFDLFSFQRYMNLLKSRNDPAIEWEFIDPEKIEVQEKEQEKKLCLADGLAHSVFKALEPDRWWEHYELAYFELIKDNLWENPITKQVIDNGFTLMPTRLWGMFIRDYPWLQSLL